MPLKQPQSCPRWRLPAAPRREPGAVHARGPGLGAAPVQIWKEMLREDFAREEDNFESKEKLKNLARMSRIMKARAGDDLDELMA